MSYALSLNIRLDVHTAKITRASQYFLPVSFSFLDPLYNCNQDNCSKLQTTRKSTLSIDQITLLPAVRLNFSTSINQYHEQKTVKKILHPLFPKEPKSNLEETHLPSKATEYVAFPKKSSEQFWCPDRMDQENSEVDGGERTVLPQKENASGCHGITNTASIFIQLFSGAARGQGRRETQRRGCVVQVQGRWSRKRGTCACERTRRRSSRLHPGRLWKSCPLSPRLLLALAVWLASSSLSPPSATVGGCSATSAVCQPPRFPSSEPRSRVL